MPADLSRTRNLEEWELTLVADGAFDQEACRRYKAQLLRLVIEGRIFPYLNKDPLGKLDLAEIITVMAGDGGGDALTSITRLRRFSAEECVDDVNKLLEMGERGIYFTLDSSHFNHQNEHRCHVWGITEGKKILIIEFTTNQRDSYSSARLIKTIFRVVSLETFLDDEQLPVEKMLIDVLDYLHDLEQRRQELLRNIRDRLSRVEEDITLLEMKEEALARGYCSK